MISASYLLILSTLYLCRETVFLLVKIARGISIPVFRYNFELQVIREVVLRSVFRVL